MGATVYRTTDISPGGLVAIYRALGREARGKVAVKISTGEPGGHNFLQPALIGDMVRLVDGTIVEGNTAYDCDPDPAEPDMADIGILASLDPVALDRACVDLVRAAPDGERLVERMDSRNGTHCLDYAAEIGLGSLRYDLVSIDD